MSNVIKLTGSNYIRQRVILATLSGKSLKLTKIRENEANPGLLEEEMNMLRLIESFTNGTTIKVNDDGTVLFYSPGMLSGGTITHRCHRSRGVSYYVEVILALAPFCAEPLNVTLTGCVTNAATDISIDHYRLSVLPVLRQFGLYDRETAKLSIKIAKRGAFPNGGGEVVVSVPNPKKLRPVQALEKGKIRRIRGCAYSTRVSPQTPGRMVETARAVLNQFLPDVFIFADVATGHQTGKSPGYGVCLTAESTNDNVRLSAEVMSGDKSSLLPAEDMGQLAALKLLETIGQSGVCDQVAQPLVILFAALNPGSVSKVLCGQLTPYSVELLRHMKTFLGVTFRLEQVDEASKSGGPKVKLTCIGVGIQNLAKKTL